MAVSVFNLGSANFGTSDPLKGAQAYHRPEFDHTQTGTVAAATVYKKIQKAGTINQVRAAITETIATGADRTVTIDVQKSTGGGAFASVLSSTIVFTNVSTLLVDSTGTINTSTVAAGDTLKITVAVAGVAGNQALGLSVGVQLEEQPT